MTRRRWLAALVAALVVAVIAVVVVNRDDDRDDASPSVGELVDPALLDDAGRELVTLVERGRTFVHHARYERTGGGRSEVWFDRDRVREDEVTDAGDERRVVREGDEGFVCVDEGEGWTCSDSERTSTGVQDRLEQLVTDLQGATVTADTATIADQEARCFVVVSPEGEVEVCLTLAGALARLAVDDEVLELVELDTVVDDDVFDRPS